MKSKEVQEKTGLTRKAIEYSLDRAIRNQGEESGSVYDERGLLLF